MSLRDDLKDLNEGCLMHVDQLEPGIEVHFAFKGLMYEVHKYSSGTYGIPVKKGEQLGILKLSSARAKERFSEMLLDHRWLPFVFSVDTPTETKVEIDQ